MRKQTVQLKVFIGLRTFVKVITLKSFVDIVEPAVAICLFGFAYRLFVVLFLSGLDALSTQWFCIFANVLCGTFSLTSFAYAAFAYFQV